MKSILVLSLLVVVANCSLEEIWNALSSKDKDIFDTCIKEQHLQDKPIEKTTEQEVKCMVHCVMEKEGDIKDGVILEEAVQKELKEEEHVNDDFKKKAAEKIPGCISETKDVADKCEKAFSFTACMMKAMAS